MAMSIAEQALALIRPGTVIGLGTGRAATEFVRALGAAVRDGLRITGVPTSVATADLAAQLGIPLTTLDQVDEDLDATFDGADEVAPNLDLIKGLGGALLREKIVAASSRRLIILVGPGKEVEVLGTGETHTLPVEVVPFGLPLVRRRLGALGYPAVPRVRDGALFVTDNGNYTLDLDCRDRPIADPGGLERAIRSIPGVVDTGLFLGMAETVLIRDDGGTVRVRRRHPA
jgi:ribose 5-phosphate isomerase A